MSASMEHLPEPEASTGPPDDHAWHLDILQAAIADPAAFAPLYRRYATDIHYFCYRRLLHPEDAADATSLVFVKVLRALPGYRPGSANAGGAFRAWLFRIARTTVIDLQRRRRPADPLDPAPGDAEALPVRSPDIAPDEQAIRNEDARLFHTILASLPDRQRLIVELRLAGLSGQEIADSLAISLAAMKAAQFRAYRTLRRRLRESHHRTNEDALP